MEFQYNMKQHFSELLFRDLSNPTYLSPIRINVHPQVRIKVKNTEILLQKLCITKI